MRDDACIFDYRHRCEELPQAEVDRLLAETGYRAQDPRDAAFVMARWAYYQHSLQEAARLGLPLHPERRFVHNPLALIEEVVGDGAGEALAEHYGFAWRVAECMWDVLDTRRDGEALLCLIGDDRGRARHHLYWLAVAWSPAELEAALGYTPGLV